MFKDKLKSKIFLFLTPGYMLYIFLLSFCFLILSGDEIKKVLVDVHFYFLEINFFLIVVGLILVFPLIKNLILKVPPKILFSVLAIAIVGTLLTSAVAPQTHRIYYDEDIYQNVGQNLAELQKAQLCNNGGTSFGVYYCQEGIYNKQPYAYPYLLSIIYRIFNVSEASSFIFNNILLAASVIIVFLLTFLLFNNYFIGIFSALIYTLIPQNLLWFNTTAVEPSSSLFGALFIFSLIIFLKESSNSSLFLTSVLASFSIQFRPESFLIIFIGLIGIFMFKPAELRSSRIYSAGLLFLVLSFAFVVHLIVTSSYSWGTTESKLSIYYFLNNISVNSSFYIENEKFPILFTLLFVVSFISKSFTKEKILLGSWFLFFWGVFLFFYAGSYEYGADVRYSLVSYIPLSVLAGLGTYQLQSLIKNSKFLKLPVNSILITLILISFLKFFPQVRDETQEAWGARADHLYAKEFAELMPENSIVLTHIPSMFQLWGKNAAQISFATYQTSYVNQVLFNQYAEGVYLHWNYWCNADDSLQNSFCHNALNNYDHELIKEHKKNDNWYVLYRLKLKEKDEIKYKRAIYPKMEMLKKDSVK